MDTVQNTIGGKSGVDRRPAILYPLMVIAAIAVIVFSVAGIAAMMGWLPSVHSQADPGASSAPSPAETDAAPRSGPSAAHAVSRPNIASSPAAGCSNCGVVESIRPVERKGQGSGLGAIGGALVGGILGNQVGRGSGRTAATVVGAGAGAYAGNEIEKSTKTTVAYQVRVRMSDGSIRTFHEASQPALSVGQKVRVTDSGVAAAG